LSKGLSAAPQEIVVELLSKGADIAIFSNDGNNCLHFAAINDRKGIVEVLLRSGADPSIPNTAGILPVELATDAAVRELFLRDRSAIFSPMVQTRMLLSDYVEQMQLGNSPQISGTALSNAATGQASGLSETNSGSGVIISLADLLDEAAARTVETPEALQPARVTPPKSPLAVAIEPVSPTRLDRQFSALDRY
jgi:hypothetical protein